MGPGPARWNGDTRPKLPRLEDADAALGGKAHAIVSGGTAVEYDLAIPVEHENEVIAYVVMGDHWRGGRE